MNCPIHGEIKGFTCRDCFAANEEKLALQRFRTLPGSTYRLTLKSGHEHVVIGGWGKKTLCGHMVHEKDLGVHRLHEESPRAIPKICEECCKIGWG
jgi:hypothetical protein